MRRSWWCVGALVCGLAGCDTGAVDEDTDLAGDTDTTGDTDTAVGDTDGPTFEAVQTQAFASCGGFGLQTCHSREPFGGGLDLMSGDAYDQLVNVTAEVGGLRVKPGSPEESVLWRKLVNDLPGDGSMGDPMPKGEAIQWTSLSQEDLDLVRAWILAGAPR